MELWWRQILFGSNPKNVLDFGCGYNQFKPRIKNLTGIDPFNENADYMVDILDFNVDEKYDHMIVFGSLNFGDEADIRTRFKKLYSLLDVGGRIRVNLFFIESGMYFE